MKHINHLSVNLVFSELCGKLHLYLTYLLACLEYVFTNKSVEGHRRTGTCGLEGGGVG